MCFPPVSDSTDEGNPPARHSGTKRKSRRSRTTRSQDEAGSEVDPRTLERPPPPTPNRAARTPYSYVGNGRIIVN